MKAIFQNEEIGDPAYDGLTFGGYALTTPLLKADYPGLRAIRLEDGTVILAEDLPDSYTIPPGGGGGGGDHADSDHADAFSALGHTHAVHADTDHDDRFSQLAHTHAVTAQPLDWLTDVATAGQTSTNVLTYNGTTWVPAAVPASGHTHAAHADSDHDDRFALIEHDSAHSDVYSALAHTHAAHADSDHDDRFSLLAHAHAGVYAPVEHDTTHDDRFSLLAHTHAAHADTDHDDRFTQLGHTHSAGDVTGPGYRWANPSYYYSSTTFTKASYPSLWGVFFELVGGGGGGGGAGSSGAAVASVGGGGAGGSYTNGFFLAAALPTSAVITVGAGGNGGATGANNGSAGEHSYFHSYHAEGGAGGTASGAAAASGTSAGGAGSTASSLGDLKIAGGDGWSALWRNAGAEIVNFGIGGGTQYGQINRSQASTAGLAGANGKEYGGGGNGGFNYPSQGTAKAGGNGAPGLVIVHRVYGDQ